VARSAAEIENLRSAWESLWNSELTLFQSYRWNAVAARIFAQRQEPYVVFAESDSGAAILPVAIDLGQRQLTFLGETLFDYRDYLAQGATEVLQAAWAALVQLNLPLQIVALRRPEAPIWNRLPKSPYSGAPYLLSSSITSEQFSANHTRKGSRLRRLFRMGMEFGTYTGQKAKLLEEIYRCKGDQNGALFTDRLRRDFMCTVAQAEGLNCEVFTLEKENKIIAALVTFRDGNYRRLYTTYYDHHWARYSPGIELIFETTRRSLQDHLDLDFMTGEQEYKMRIATAVAPLYQVEVSAEELRLAGQGRPAPGRAA
jgi:CelD/BcsL family acetyltransferase involved in cellulose biosynthesis